LVALYEVLPGKGADSFLRARAHSVWGKSQVASGNTQSALPFV